MVALWSVLGDFWGEMEVITQLLRESHFQLLMSLEILTAERESLTRLSFTIDQYMKSIQVKSAVLVINQLCDIAMGEERGVWSRERCL